jgi:phospholipid transport system substrate-binding protein
MLTLLVSLAVAAAPATPMGVVKTANDEVQTILKTEGASVDQLSQKADAYIDFAELAKRALGKEWPKLNKKQQDEFSKTMKELLRVSYAQKALVDGKNGPGVEYVGEKVTGAEASVQTTIQVKKDTFPVEYKLFKPDAKTSWKIYDVVTDGVSLVSTYSDQFRQLLAKKGFDGLLQTIKAKRDQLAANAANPATNPTGTTGN